MPVSRSHASTLLDEIAREAMSCRACHLWQNASRTVFGEGGPTARMMLVGEQPGDQEDVDGRPFVGPAGRIHDKPNRQEVLACKPWLERELELVEPKVLMALGATAAQSLLGTSFKLTAHLGEVMTSTGLAPRVIATVHPSLVLRTREPGERQALKARLTGDLATALSFT